MFDHLDIYDPRERWLVGLADRASRRRWRLAGPADAAPRRRATPRRILLLRLERIGDLLMSLGAIAAVRRARARGRRSIWWSAAGTRRSRGSLAEVNPSKSSTRRGSRAAQPAALHGGLLASRAAAGVGRHYDLAINFEGDIRSHGLLALAGARRRVGFGHGRRRSAADRRRARTTPRAMSPPTAWRSSSARSICRRARCRRRRPPKRSTPRGSPLPDACAGVGAGGARATGRRTPPGVVCSGCTRPGGRAIKQWPAERFAEAGRPARARDRRRRRAHRRA